VHGFSRAGRRVAALWDWTCETSRVDRFSGRNSIFPESSLRSLGLNVRKQKARGQFCDTWETFMISGKKSDVLFTLMSRVYCLHMLWTGPRVMAARGPVGTPVYRPEVSYNSWGRRNRLCAKCCTYVEIMGSRWKKIWLWVYPRIHLGGGGVLPHCSATEQSFFSTEPVHAFTGIESHIPLHCGMLKQRYTSSVNWSIENHGRSVLRVPALHPDPNPAQNGWWKVWKRSIQIRGSAKRSVSREDRWLTGRRCVSTWRNAGTKMALWVEYYTEQ
jgi:hypothetical protein